MVQNETPVVRNETLVVRNEMPVVRYETPVVRNETPVVQNEMPAIRNKRRNSNCSPRRTPEPCLLDCDLVKVRKHNIYLLLRGDRFDGNCYFGGLILLPYCYMVFIDKNKDTVTLVNRAFRPVFCTGIEGTPQGITLLRNELIAVAIPKAVCIYIATIDDKLERREKYKTRGIINSIASCYGGDLAILYSDNDVPNQRVEIQISRWDNKIVREISDFSHIDNGPYDPSCPRVLRSQRNDEFVVAEGREVVAFDSDEDMK